MHTIFLALGTNVGERKQHIEDAIEALQEKIHDMVQAPIYESKPVGFTDQANFYNTVTKGQTELSPEALLQFVKSLEKKLGRVKRFANGPREIDIDILLYDDAIINSQDLIIPHPRMHERDFVLQPLVDISPDIIHPVLKKTVKRLLQKISVEKKSIIIVR